LVIVILTETETNLNWTIHKINRNTRQSQEDCTGYPSKPNKQTRETNKMSEQHWVSQASTRAKNTSLKFKTGLFDKRAMQIITNREKVVLKK